MHLRPPRDYQQGPIEEAIRACHSHGSTALISPTGSGKTDMGCHIAYRLAGEGGILWQAPSVDLVDQTADRVRLAGVEPRVLQGGERGDAASRFTIATVHTLLAMHRRGDPLPTPDVVVYDEARCHLAPEWRVLLEVIRPRYRLALDATPSRTDGAAFRDLVASMVRGPSMLDLQALGFLVPVSIRGPDERCNVLAADPALVYAKALAGRRAIVYCQDIAHAEHVARGIQERGFRAKALHQDIPRSERRDAIARFRAGELHVLTNVMTLFQGLDVPELEGVIVARGVSTDEAWIQIGGRVARACPAIGKTHGLMFDLHGSFHNWGRIEDHREYSLTGEPIRRLEPLPPAVKCRSCLSWGSGGICQVCKAELPPPPPPKVLAKDLVEMRSARDDDAKRLATLERYIREEIAKGHNPWRAQHRYKGTYGEPPIGRIMRDAVARVQRRAVA